MFYTTLIDGLGSTPNTITIFIEDIMKINFYTDIFPGASKDNLFATSTPSTNKAPGTKRYKIAVDIPDYAFTGVIDGVLPVEECIEVDKD